MDLGSDKEYIHEHCVWYAMLEVYIHHSVGGLLGGLSQDHLERTTRPTMTTNAE